MRPQPKLKERIFSLSQFDNLKDMVDYFFGEDIELNNVMINEDKLIFQYVTNELEYYEQLNNYLNDLRQKKIELEKEIKEVQDILKPF